MRDWAEMSFRDLMGRWRDAVDSPGGLFNPNLDRKWRRRSGGELNLVSQSRLIYNFSIAFEVCGEAPYAEAARRGADALVRVFRTADERGWNWACDENGRVTEDDRNAYGYAFVILGLATAARVLDYGGYRELAMDTWRNLKRRLAEAPDGLVWHLNPKRTLDRPIRCQNPLMHTFEALMALAGQDRTGEITRDAQELWRFIEGLVREDGALAEWYEEDWSPVKQGQLAVADLGHAIQWGLLLSDADRLGVLDDAMDHAHRFVDFAIQHGHDRERGGLISPLALGGSPVRRRKTWWEQNETVRALARFVHRHGRTDLCGPLERTLDFAKRHFIDPKYGGWYMVPTGFHLRPRRNKGSAWKVDYHAVNMYLELMDRPAP